MVVSSDNDSGVNVYGPMQALVIVHNPKKTLETHDLALKHGVDSTKLGLYMSYGVLGYLFSFFFFFLVGRVEICLTCLRIEIDNCVRLRINWRQRIYFCTGCPVIQNPSCCTRRSQVVFWFVVLLNSWPRLSVWQK